MKFPSMIGCACTLFAGLQVMAQAPDDRELALRACLEIERDRDRLDCLETALGAGADQDQAAPSTERSAPSERAPRNTRNPEPGAASRSDTAAGDADTPRRSARNERAAPNDAVSRSDRAQSGATDAQQTIIIVEVFRNSLGQTRFVTQDGVTYVQTSTQRGRYPETPFEAELEPGARETFFLSSPLGGPRVRVDRLD